MHSPMGWPADRFVRDEHDINLNPLTPPGEYRVQVAIVGVKGQPLGREVTCGVAEVTDRRGVGLSPPEASSSSRHIDELKLAPH